MDFSASNDKKNSNNSSAAPRSDSKKSYPVFSSSKQPTGFASAKSQNAPFGAKTMSANEKSESQSLSASERAPHKLELDPLHSLSMTGVRDVPTFTDKSATVKLDGETLLVQGQGLALKSLDTESGKLQITGRFFSLKYSAQATPSSFIKKLFK